MSTIPSTAHDLVRQSIEVDRLEQELKEAKRRKEELSALVAEEYQNSEIRNQKVTVDGRDYLVYRKRDIHASVPTANRERLVEVFQAMGFDDFIKTEVPTAKVKAYMIEQASGDGDADDYDWDAVPEEIRSLVSVYETVKAVVRKG